MSGSSNNRDRILKEALVCRAPLMAYARSLLGDYATAEDVVQEAMLVVVRKYDQFEEGTSMLAWCRAIVRFEVLRHQKKRGRERTLIERLLDDAVDAAFEEFSVGTSRSGERVRTAVFGRVPRNFVRAWTSCVERPLRARPEL